MAREQTWGANDATNNIVYPYPWNPLPLQPYQWQPTFTYTWASWDEARIAALEARIAQLERENKRLRRGLGKLFIWRKGL